MNAAVTLTDLLQAKLPREHIELWCRQQARGISISGDLVLSRVLGKYLLYSLGTDSAITPHLAMDGIWEPWVTMAIARHVAPGMRCLDVGACYGYYTVLMADLVGRAGSVTAYEPVPETYELLAGNLSLNGLLQRCTVRRRAVGAQTDQQAILEELPRNGLGLRNIGGTSVRPWDPVIHGHLARHEYTSFEAPVGHYDFIKIDAEGAEADVWSVVTSCMSEHAAVCMEFTPRRHEDPRQFLRDVRVDGFLLGTVGSDGTPRKISEDEALVPDTGDFRTLWLTKS